jgi:nitrogen regulatory protein PII
MHLQPLKLITLITEQVLREQIARKILELGATGYTWSEVQGVGPRGTRRDAVEGNNIQIKIVCSAEIADAILTWFSRTYVDHYACIAWVIEVSVVHGERYIKSAK